MFNYKYKYTSASPLSHITTAEASDWLTNDEVGGDRDVLEYVLLRISGLGPSLTGERGTGAGVYCGL